MLQSSSSHHSRGKSSHVNRNRADAASGSSTMTAHFGADSVKMVAESMGISNLADDAARLLADDITMRLKCIVQDAAKFASHGRRTQLSFVDIEFALKNKNMSPMFGYNDPDLLPFRYASGGGRELFFQEDKEVELTDVINMSSMAKLPQDVALKNHWLSIDGVQPAIPDNPPPLSREKQGVESIDPSLVLKLQSLPNNTPFSGNQNKFISQKKKNSLEVIKVKQYAAHELSVEQQLYYKEITEACVGSDENRRTEALKSLTSDSGLYQMLPRLCTFISEGVKVNVVQKNLALLIYLMRMVKALLDNHNLYLEKYLHELIPTVITCIVSRQLCLRPEQDNHWALRDFASGRLTQICRNFNTTTNNIQVRVTQLLSKALDNDRIVLPSLYGAISCLCEMGPEVQRTFLLKRLKFIGERIRPYNQGNGPNQVDNKAAEHIQSLLFRVLPPTIKNIRSPPDILDDYINDYGIFGKRLHEEVLKLRPQNQPKFISFSSAGQGGQMNPANIAQIRRLSNTAPSGQQQGQSPQQSRFAVIQTPSQTGTSGQTYTATQVAQSMYRVQSVQREGASLIASSSGTQSRFIVQQQPGTAPGPNTPSNQPSTSHYSSNFDHQN